MWLVALAFVLAITAGGLYEIWAFRFREDLTITALTQRHAHLMLILVGAFFTLLGYALGIGGP